MIAAGGYLVFEQAELGFGWSSKGGDESALLHDVDNVLVDGFPLNGVSPA